MKIRHIFASSLEALPKKKLIVRKLTTTALLTAVMAVATSFYAVKHRQPAGATEASLNGSTSAIALTEIPPRGLSRKRADFEKALDILATAANNDSHLSDYYKRVARRVAGHSTPAEMASGVRAMRVRRDPPVDPDKMVADVAMPVPQLPGADALPGIATASADDEPAATTATENASELADGDVPAQLTVGDMTFQVNPAIEHWVNYYTTTKTGRQTMTIGITRSSAFLEMARQEFRRAGLPEDLVWLAHVESVWNPRAVSPAAAGGIWQFIPKTAKEYGMTVESGNDERADPLKQTRVAASYLRDLYTLFGDWALAMAAYNSGEPRVMEAVVKNGRANFWEIYNKQLLPKETCNYVPKILAAIEVASRADQYGFTTASDDTAGH
ncbi:MAG TPA: lytic transglycosylase domain-containing protein [Blastocatellia bacterium]|nr:lytic transglycosylase domain-containing protein [Blastocatellia bacterium]